jgi:hypothetical protein
MLNATPKMQVKFVDADAASLIDFIRSNEIGAGIPVPSPFGTPRLLLYVDHTASGRALTCLEDNVQKVVLPYYGNTVRAQLYPARLGQRWCSFRVPAWQPRLLGI